MSYWWDITWPLIVLGVFAAVIPSVMARVLSHTMGALIFNGLASALLLILISGAYVYHNWGMQGQMLGALERGLKFSLLWAPILLSVLVVQPQKWRPDL